MIEAHTVLAKVDHQLLAMYQLFQILNAYNQQISAWIVLLDFIVKSQDKLMWLVLVWKVRFQCFVHVSVLGMRRTISEYFFNELHCFCTYWKFHIFLNYSLARDLFSGFYCPLGSSSATQEGCEIGMYCPAQSSESFVCDDGTYAPTTHSPTCDICPEGFYCLASNVIPGDSDSIKTACSPGYFCPNGTGM